MLRMLHWSDPHGKAELVSQTCVLASQLGIEYNICTGDIVPDYFEQGINGIDLSNTYFVLGNHDLILQSGTNPEGYEWDKKPTEEQAYTRYFKNWNMLGNVVMQENTTWWYKTISDEKIMIIGLDTQATGTAGVDELTWLNNLLDNANKQNLSVVVLGHPPVSTLRCIDNSWLDRPYYPNMIPDTQSFESDWYPYSKKLYDDVNTWADKGVNVVCWLCGHEHADALFIGGNVSKYPFITVNSTIQDRYSDLYRSEYGTVDAICANLVEYIPEERVLRVYRYGAGTSRGGLKRRCCIWGYDESNWIEWLDRSEGL